jgi:hypothetical protein
VDQPARRHRRVLRRHHWRPRLFAERRRLTTIHVPGSTPETIQALGINRRKDIAGYYGHSNDFPSNWLLSKGTFTAPITESLRPEPGDCNGIPNAINPKGDIVGTYFAWYS